MKRYRKIPRQQTDAYQQVCSGIMPQSEYDLDDGDMPPETRAEDETTEFSPRNRRGSLVMMSEGGDRRAKALIKKAGL